MLLSAVGIDLGPTTVAVSGENIASIDKLASKCDNIQEKTTFAIDIDIFFITFAHKF